MKRFRLGTLMGLMAIAALCCALPGRVMEALQGSAEMEYRFVELQRMFMMVIAALAFSVAKWAREMPRGGLGWQSSGEVKS
jgi:hypothetical protein